MANPKKIAEWTLTGLLSAALLASAGFKFFSPEAAANFAKMGLGEWLTIIAVGELVSTLLFLIPRTSSLGYVLLTAYFGGAVVAHMVAGTSVLVPSLFLVLLLITNYLRNPNILESFTKE